MSNINFKNSNSGSWNIVRLGDFVVSEKGKKAKHESKFQTAQCSIPYIDIQAFEEGIFNTWTDPDSIRNCFESDILMVWDGSRAGLVGRGVRGALGSTLVRINFPNISNGYAYYFLKSKYREINTRAKGSGTPHVDPELLWNYEFPIAPLELQKKIVEKIDFIFDELDRISAELRDAISLVNQYKQSVFQGFFSGCFTENFRKSNECRISDEALSLIKQNNSKKKPVPPFQSYEIDLLPDIPNCWRWTKIGELFEVFLGSTPSRSKPEYWGDDISWVSSGEVCFKKINVTNEKISNVGFSSISSKVHPVGTVMLAMIGEGKTRGQAGILGIPAAHNQNTAAIRPGEIGIDPRYIYYWFMYQYEQTRRIGSGNNQKALNKARVESIPFPLTSCEEAKQIADLIDVKIGAILRLESDIVKIQSQIEILRESVMRAAFSGELIT